MYIKKLNEIFDVNKLQEEVSELLSKHSLTGDQLALNHRSGYIDTCWSDGCGSPFLKSKTDVDPTVSRKSDPVPRFVDTDFQFINPGLENSEINKIYNVFKDKFKLGRYRLAVLRPKSCYGWHYDLEKRIHVPVYTNSGSFLITDDGKATHLPATGESWMFNANNGYHTAMNASYTENRIHLLLNVW